MSDAGGRKAAKLLVLETGVRTDLRGRCASQLFSGTNSCSFFFGGGGLPH